MSTVGGEEAIRETEASSVPTSSKADPANSRGRGASPAPPRQQDQDKPTDEDVQALIFIAWQAGTLTTNAWKSFIKGRGERRAAEEVKRTIDEFTSGVGAFDPRSIRTRVIKLWRKDRYRIKRLAYLASEHARIRAEFLKYISVNNPLALSGAAQVVGDSLERAREELSRKDADLSIVSSYIGLADGAVARLYPDSEVKIRCSSILFRLKVLAPAQIGLITEHIEEAIKAKDLESLEALRQALADGLEAIHQREEEEDLADELQLQRLRRARRFVSAVLVLLLLASPLLVNSSLTPPANAQASPSSTDLGWPVPLPTNLSALLKMYLIVAAIGIVGAVGGTLSGLLSARDTRARLSTYRTDMIKLSLKPIVGALVAVVLYTLLSWNIVPGISVTTGGTYIALGLLAGFSERFFLRLLKGFGEEPRQVQQRESLTPEAPNPYVIGNQDRDQRRASPKG